MKKQKQTDAQVKQEAHELIVKEAKRNWDAHKNACRILYPSEILNNYPVKSKLIVEVAINSIQGIQKCYCDGAAFNGIELKAAVSLASKIRIVWSNEGLMLSDVPLAKNLDWPDKQDFFRLEQWFLNTLAAMAKIDSLEGIAYFPKDEESLEDTPKAKVKEAFIPYGKAITLSNGILTRKLLNKAIKFGKPVLVRSDKPSKNRNNVHIQDVLKLISKLSANEKGNEEAAKMFGQYKEMLQKKQNGPNLD